MTNIETLKQELIGMETTLIGMDNAMEGYGFPTAFNSVDENTMLDNGSVSYPVDTDDNVPEWIDVEFDVVNFNENAPEDSEIKITGISEL